MQAKETKLQDIIEGTKQYVIPLFQRTYSWIEKDWETLWKDLVELSEMENPRTHFIGSIVNMPTTSVPEGVAKYLLIDGQQRLTTIFILLILLRNKAKEPQNTRFADEINNTLLVNQYKDGIDHYKLMPTQVDRKTYFDLIDGKSPTNNENQLTKAYRFFEKQLQKIAIEPEKLKKIITNYFSVVSIVLDSDDNPYLVFESLNAKGRSLTQADLIRNYFFMRIHTDKQDEMYEKFWLPMQEALKDDLTEFIRHYLMKEGNIVKKDDIYYSLKENVTSENAIDSLKELKRYSVFYQRLKYPEFEKELELEKMFRRLNRLEVTTAYPLLLNFYNNYDNSTIDKEGFVDTLKTLENYLIRRFVCNIATNQLNKIFPSVIQALQKDSGNILDNFKTILQSKNYPKDSEFLSRLKDARLYGSGDRVVKTKLILETIENSYNHKEEVPFDKLTIEHIMPQTLSEWWQKHLGEEWDDIHELYLHTIGNLTLTAYNAELSNDDFITKKNVLDESHLEMNKYFVNIHKWTKTEIENRTEILAKKTLEIWSYFGTENSSSMNSKEITGTSPTILRILGQEIKVKTWRDVMEKTLNVIADIEPEKFEIITKNFPRYVGKDQNKFRAIRKLENDYFIGVNLNAQSIQKFCYQAIETIGLTSDDWKVETR